MESSLKTESLSKPKRIHCFICGNVRENEGGNLTLFNVPKGKLEEWRVAIGNNQLKQTSRLCDIHFLDENIIKGKQIGGYFFNAKIWRLQKDAIPKLFLRLKPLKALNVQNTNVAQKKKSLHIVTNILPIKEKEIVVTKNQLSPRTNPDCSTIHLSCKEPTTKSLDTNTDNDSIMDTEDACAAALIVLPVKENEIVVPNIQLGQPTDPSAIAPSSIKSTTECLESDLSSEQQDEIRKCWDILLSYMPGLRNTLDHAGLFCRRRSAVSNNQQRTTSPSMISTAENATDLSKGLHLSSRTCWNCSKPTPVSNTRKKMRKNHCAMCRKCYSIMIKLENLEKCLMLQKIKHKKLKILLNNAKKKIDGKNKTIKELRSQLEK